MYSTTHLALGLIIGKVSGNYPAALIGSLLIDIDHLIPLTKKSSGSIKKFFKNTTSSSDSSRNYLHNIIFWLAISFFLLFINFNFALVFSLAHLGHLLLDILDNSSFYPFYPSKKIDIRGFIPYYSRQELFFALFLFFIYIII